MAKKIKKTEEVVEKKSKKAKSEDKQSSVDKVKRIKGTVIPESFGDFVDAVLKFANVKHKKTVSTFHDGDDLFFTIPRQGSSLDRITLFMNKSTGWKPEEEFSHLTIDKWYTGDIRVSVTSDKKSIAEAVKLCKLWKNIRPSFKVAKSASNDDAEEEPQKIKKVKKVKKAKESGGNGEIETKVKKTKKIKKIKKIKEEEPKEEIQEEAVDSVQEEAAE